MRDQSVNVRKRDASEGIAFPAADGGQRSTAAFGRDVLAAAVAVAAPTQAAAIRAERRWRENYAAHVRRLVERSLHSGTAAVDIARAGLAAIAAQMRFVRDGAESDIGEAMAAPRPALLRSITIDGRGSDVPAPLSVPYAGRDLSGDALLRQVDNWLALGRLFERNVEAALVDDFGIADALIVQQGPNYALAKRLQQWRALVARADGQRASVHIAPPSMTGSVLKNRLMAAAYRSASMFGVEAFAPETASALMAALLVHDLRHPQAAANPHTPLAHPLLLLAEAAQHGGLWRMPFAARSALPVAALIGALRGG